MEIIDDISDAIKDGLKKAWKGLRSALAYLGLGCFVGIGVEGFLMLWNSLANGDRVPLSERTKRVMRNFFPNLDLDQVRIVTNASIPTSKRAMVIGNDIFWKGDFDECGNDYRDMILLLEELYHVYQYQDGIIAFACRYGHETLLNGYDNNPLEIEAKAFKANHEEALSDIMDAECIGVIAEGSSSRRDSWLWLLWGCHD